MHFITMVCWFVFIGGVALYVIEMVMRPRP